MMSDDDRLKSAAPHKAPGESAGVAVLTQGLQEFTPCNAGEFDLLAEIRFVEGDVDQALQHVARTPDCPRQMARLGRLYAQQGDHEKAVTYLETAYLTLPNDPLVMLFLAESQSATGLTSEASVLAKRLTTHFPSLLSGWLLLIRLEAMRGDTRMVFADFLKQIRRHPDKSAALVALAKAYRSLGYFSIPTRLLRPFLEDSDQGCPQHRSQALALLRDCMLASDDLQDLARTLAEPAGSAETDSHSSAVTCRVADGIPNALAQNDLLIEAALSNLDALVLLRFVTTAPTDMARRRIFSAAHITPLAALFGTVDFVALDSASGRQMLDVAQDPVPLTSVVKLPADEFVLRRRTGPYVLPEAAKRRKWQDVLQQYPRPLVGLAWNEHRPGLLLEDYGLLLRSLEGFRGTLLSVMGDKARDQLAPWSSVVDCGRQFEDLSDLSALLSETDLLIGPDGLPTHVAGAMGRPAVVLTQPAYPWYWHAKHGHATWYPSVQVLKSKRFGHWAGLMEDLTAPLKAMVGNLVPKTQVGSQTDGFGRGSHHSVEAVPRSVSTTERQVNFSSGPEK